MRLQSRAAGEACARLAARQFGAVGRGQLLAAGFSPSRIHRWLKDGRLHGIYPGVFAYGRGDLEVAGQLAAGLLFSGPGAALTSVSGLWWLGLLERRPDFIHLAAPGGVRSRQDLRISHPHRVERNLHRGLPVVPLPQALLTASPFLSHNSLRLVLARAEFRGILSMPAVHAALRDRPHGGRGVRAALDSHLPQLACCATPLEVDFVLLCEEHDVPLPEPNARVGRYRPDMLWRSSMLIVELDGWQAHHTNAQLAADRCRQADLEQLGYTVLRFGWDEIHDQPARVASQVLGQLAASASAA